jgi:hypothetical protein
MLRRLTSMKLIEGCSMAAMIIYTVVIKEGALPKLREIVLIVAFGCKLDLPRDVVS